jgi:short-subunit dehydrogenase
VVANAGIAHYGPFREQAAEAVERMTRVNWLGTVHLVAAALPHLLERGHGHVVIVSSGAGHRAFPSAAVYGATKAAQRGFGEALRHELAGTGVSLTMVYPGEIATSLHDHERATMPAWYRGGPQAASADELAEKVVAAIERDRRAVHFPPAVRLLAALHGLSPRAADVLLRTLRGSSAAPRRG